MTKKKLLQKSSVLLEKQRPKTGPRRSPEGAAASDGHQSAGWLVLALYPVNVFSIAGTRVPLRFSGEQKPCGLLLVFSSKEEAEAFSEGRYRVAEIVVH